MPSKSAGSRLTGRFRLSGPAELAQAVPYLLGFAPGSSLVLVGLHDSALVVTARLDLVDGDPTAAVRHTLHAMVRAGSTEVVVVVCDDSAVRDIDPDPEVPLPWWWVVDIVDDEAMRFGCRRTDALLVAGGSWWSYLCADPECCPRSGRPLPDEPSTYATAATVAGVAVLPNRNALAAQLDPCPEADQPAMLGLVEQEENAVAAAASAGGSQRRERAVKRAIFAAARASDTARWVAPSDQEVARFGVALAGYLIRDPVWMAVDDDRLNGRELWRTLATRLPAPYRAAPLFLLGWRAWRHGEGALARIAVERAIEADPGYSAADLVLAALDHGTDPRQIPRLRPRRSA